MGIQSGASLGFRFLYVESMEPLGYYSGIESIVNLIDCPGEFYLEGDWQWLVPDTIDVGSVMGAFRVRFVIPTELDGVPLGATTFVQNSVGFATGAKRSCDLEDRPLLMISQAPPSARPVSGLVDFGFGVGNRYLGVKTDPADAGVSQAIRITFTDLAPPFDVWNGEHLWVQEPALRCENSGEREPPCTGPTFHYASLGCMMT